MPTHLLTLNIVCSKQPLTTLQSQLRCTLQCSSGFSQLGVILCTIKGGWLTNAVCVKLCLKRPLPIANADWNKLKKCPLTNPHGPCVVVCLDGWKPNAQLICKNDGEWSNTVQCVSFLKIYFKIVAIYFYCVVI